MKRYDLYSKHDPTKNFSPLPNEVFYLGLSYGAIAVYGYLMHIEDRKTFQSYARQRLQKAGRHHRHHPGRAQAQRYTALPHPSHP